MKPILTLFTMAALTVSAIAYDVEKAQELDHFYSKMTQQACANSTLTITAEETLKMLREEKDFLLLDVRTRGEASVISIVTPNSMLIPIENLFEQDNLKKLPTDKPIVITCYSGSRAMLAATGLKQLGFKNIRLLKGGIVSLAHANNVKNAPIK